MTIECNNEKVSRIILNSKQLQKKVGTDMGKSIIKRLNQLKASNNFYEYLKYINLGSPHHLKGDLNNCYGISISANYRLIIEPLGTKCDFESLKECVSINVKGVIDYHGGKNEWIIP